MKKILLLLFLSAWGACCHAQRHTLSGSVKEVEDRQVMKGVQLLLTVQDTLASMTTTDDKGRFAFEGLSAGKYKLHTNAPGYTPLEIEYDIRKNLTVELVLQKEISIALDSIVITANSNDRIERTATGLIFHLSEKAQNSGDPYKALKEIPQLVSNEANRSVKMEDGSSPLILIDGNRVNSGISPIDPKEIESVEIVNVVSARYLKDNVQNIVNIKLKKKERPFVYFEAMNRHNIPLNRGMGAVYFEVGNPKISLYGRLSGEYLYKDNQDMNGWQRNTGYEKRSHNKNEKNANTYLGELLLKWQCSPKDYIATHLYGINKLDKSRTEGNGTMLTAAEEAFESLASDRNTSYILTGSLYYKHLFGASRTLESTLAYNNNGNKNRGDRHEYYPDWTYHNFYKFDNTRNSGTLNINYSDEWDSNSLYIGSETGYLTDRIRQVSSNAPTFRHYRWDEYLYAVFGSKVGKLMYMISAGTEFISIKAGDNSDHYFRLRGSLSGTYNFSRTHSTRLSYTLSNTPPDVGMLNPYNTSTDSLMVIQGNPYLKPVRNHVFHGSYTFNKKGFYLSPSVRYVLNTDEIEPCGHSEDGVYVSSYRNSSRYRALVLGSSVSYRTGCGRVYGQAGHAVEYFKEQPARKSFFCSLGGMVWYKKFSFNMDVTYNNYSFTATSRTRYRTPDYSLLQATYNITPQLYVSIALEYITGALKSDVLTYSGSYQSQFSLKQNDKNLRPWILLRYTLRKNKERKINLNNVVNSREEGISL